MRLKIIIYILTVFTSAMTAAETGMFTEIFNPHFRTLKLTSADNFMSPPAIRLDTDDRLIITFDELGDNFSQLQYRLIHCNADWKPSRLVESEYIDGFNIADINDYAYSENTYIHFVNYRIVLPNEDMRPIHSGNYLLQVFERENPDKTILQARLYVTEGTAQINGTATSRTDKGFNQDWQQLEFTVDLGSLKNINAYQDITVTTGQNIDEQSIRTISAPLRTEGSLLTYAHKPELVFNAGNEYRRFESVSNSFAGMGVDSLKYIGDNYHIWLKQDRPRALRNYEFDRTQHGRFLVREYNATDSDLGADYITVHFTLDMPFQKDLDIYVDGEMTHGKFGTYNKMAYNSDKHCYTLELPLKQGAYNYRYRAFRTGDPTEFSKALPIIEGDKYETGNEYPVMVYYHPAGARADRLIGFTVLSN